MYWDNFSQMKHLPMTYVYVLEEMLLIQDDEGHNG